MTGGLISQTKHTWVQGAGVREQGAGCKEEGSREHGAVVREQGAGCRMQGAGAVVREQEAGQDALTVGSGRASSSC